jgi:hypothetical protein
MSGNKRPGTTPVRCQLENCGYLSNLLFFLAVNEGAEDALQSQGTLCAGILTE